MSEFPKNPFMFFVHGKQLKTISCVILAPWELQLAQKWNIFEVNRCIHRRDWVQNCVICNLIKIYHGQYYIPISVISILCLLAACPMMRKPSFLTTEQRGRYRTVASSNTKQATWEAFWHTSEVAAMAVITRTIWRYIRCDLSENICGTAMWLRSLLSGWEKIRSRVKTVRCFYLQQLKHHS